MAAKARHNYEYGIDLQGGAASARVIRMVGKDKRVLEIGAGPGSITKHLRTNGNCRIVGVEIDDEAIEKLSPFCEKIYKLDLNIPNWASSLEDEGKFDVVVAADVLEHVYDPWGTLKAVKGLVKEGGSIIVSLPHIGYSAVIACLLNEDFDYRNWGLLDRTHIRFFGIKNIQSLFDNAGLKIKDAEFVTVHPDNSEFAHIWRKLSSKIRGVLSKNKYGMVYQVVINAGLSATSGKGIQLMSLPVEMPRKGVADFLKSVVRFFLTDRTSIKLRNAVRILQKRG